MKSYSSEALKPMKLPELRTIAKELKINIAGKRPADIIREILKKQANAKGKGTAADPKSGEPAKRGRGRPRKVPLDEETEDEEEAVEAAPKKKASAPLSVAKQHIPSSDMTDVLNKLDYLKGQMALVIPLVAELAEFCEVALPKTWKEKSGPATSSKAAVVDDEDESEEDDDDTEADDESEPADDDDEDNEDDDDEPDEDDDEDEEEIELTAEEVAKAKLPRLVEMAEAINASTGEDTIDAAIKSEKLLRAKIVEFLEENAEKIVDDEDDEPVKAKAKSTKPSWLVEGAKVLAQYDDEWLKGEITEVNKGSANVYFIDDNSNADVDFADIRPRAKKA